MLSKIVHVPLHRITVELRQLDVNLNQKPGPANLHIVLAFEPHATGIFTAQIMTMDVRGPEGLWPRARCLTQWFINLSRLCQALYI